MIDNGPKGVETFIGKPVKINGGRVIGVVTAAREVNDRMEVDMEVDGRLLSRFLTNHYLCAKLAP